MKWRDAHTATLARHGGKRPTIATVRAGDVLVPGTALETDDGDPVGRWRILLDVGEHLQGRWDEAGELVVEPVPQGTPRRWNLWDMRAHVAGTGTPEPVAMGLKSPQTAVMLAEVLDRSRALRMLHAGLMGLSRAASAMRKEWRSQS